ncbi:hypothetical protein RF11_10730 [Thelohanellus kitauei]|uniref:Uncharacterized protein n=1 Tax=Thelohanellus kitauei TaxID=669202 RepID=A0A0C2MV44_THEKT|nr:hypothetical protein RF11_10730 [Thelohanellus kitauei]
MDHIFMMNPAKINDDQANEIPFQNYLNVKPSDSFTAQMCAVKNWISTFRHQNDIYLDLLFIVKFPTLLYDEFNRISNGESDVENYQEKKILLFEVFTFIFRYKNIDICEDPRVKQFVVCFLVFIKTHDPVSITFLNDLVDSINVCLSYEPFQVMFIEENGMFHFYYYFSFNSKIKDIMFEEMYKNAYKHVQIESYPLNFDKITNCIDEFMTDLSKTQDITCIYIFSELINILHGYKLLSEFTFDVLKLYEITKIQFYNNINNMDNIMFKPSIAILWTHILNHQKKYNFRIDTTEKVIIFASLFSIIINANMEHIFETSGIFELNKYNKQMLYLMYLYLVALPIIEDPAKPWLCNMLKRVHSSLGKYIEKCGFESTSKEHRYHIIQYYTKSLVALNVDISNPENRFLKDMFEKHRKYPSFNIQSAFLAANIILNFIDNLRLNNELPIHYKAYFSNFIYQLIFGLSGKRYILKIQQSKKLDFYEDLDSCCFSILTADLINDVLSKYESHLLNNILPKSPESEDIKELQHYKNIIENMVISFNKSNYLDQANADYYLKMYEDYYINFNEDFSDIMMKFSNLNINSENNGTNDERSGSLDKILYFQNTLQPLLRWFTLIYETKFIFKDPNFKYHNINF